MPTYEYRCKDCGEELEVVQSFQDEPLTECPRCQGRLRKVFGSIGIAFKGSGFYKTDSRASGASGSSTNGGGAGGSSSKESAGSDKSDSTGSSSSTGSSGSAGDSGAPAKSSAGSASS